MIDEKRLELLTEKITQAVRIKSVLIGQNTEALNSIKLLSINQASNSVINVLSHNLKREEDVLQILITGASDGLSIISEFKNNPESKYLGIETLELLSTIENIFQIFIADSVSAINKRFNYERAYLDTKNIAKRPFYAYMLKRSWNKELIIDHKIYSLIDTTKLTKQLEFWDSVKKKWKALHFDGLHIKGGKLDDVTANFLLNQVGIAFWGESTPAAIATAKSFAAGFVALNLSMSGTAKSILALVIWSMSGFIARLVYIMFNIKNIYRLSEVMYRSNVINNLSPKNLFVQKNLINK